MKAIIGIIFALLMITTSVSAVTPPAPEWLAVRERPCSFGTRSVYVDWKPVVDAEAYRVWVDGSILKSELPAQFENEGTQHYTHWWVEEGRTYTYWVTALQGVEESVPSPSGVITTSVCEVGPSQPQDLSVVPAGCRSTVMIWTPSDGGAYPLFAYMVRRSTVLEELYQRGSVKNFLDWVWNPPRGIPEPPNFYFDDDSSCCSTYGDPLEPGGTYFYAVQAYNWMANASELSNVVEVTMPPCP